VGRALLEALAEVARHMGRGAPVVLAAEVLEPNPAHAFYAKIGYAPVSWSARLSTSDTDDTPLSPRGTGRGLTIGPWTARQATPDDAIEIALLDPALAARRRQQGDVRFDRPRAVDATFIGALASHLARP